MYISRSVGAEVHDDPIATCAFRQARPPMPLKYSNLNAMIRVKKVRITRTRAYATQDAFLGIIIILNIACLLLAGLADGLNFGGLIHSA